SNVSKASPSAGAQSKTNASPTSGGSSRTVVATAHSISALRMLELIDVPYDDPALTRRFTAAYRLFLDHAIEFYPQSGWKRLTAQEKNVFQKYFPQAEMLLKKKELVK